MCDGALRMLAAAAMIASSCSTAPAPPAAAGSSGPGAAAAPRRRPAEFMTGDECLFCHREVGSSWDRNYHNRTVRDARLANGGGEAPAGADFALGAREPRHWLKRTEAYGTLAIRTGGAAWDDDVFGASCAGCHMSGIDPGTGAFAAISLDCFVCHGDVALEHANEPASVHLSPRRRRDPLSETAICGQCHLRGGRSRRTGRPWPSGFIAGDALLDDFEFDFSDRALAALSVADRHVAENVRDVALRGRTAVTCLACHSVHGGSSRAHRDLEETDYCFTCHVRGERRSRIQDMTRSSPVCRVDGDR